MEFIQLRGDPFYRFWVLNKGPCGNNSIQLFNAASVGKLCKTDIVINRIMNTSIVQKLFSNPFDAQLCRDEYSGSFVLHRRPAVGFQTVSN